MVKVDGFMDKMLTISVVAYNVEPYLKQCLDSLVGNWSNDFKVLIEKHRAQKRNSGQHNETGTKVSKSKNI